MLRYFRINDPYRLLAIIVLFSIVFLPLFLDAPPTIYPELKSALVGERLDSGGNMYVDVVDNTAPLAAWFHELMDFLFGRSMVARHIVALVLIFLQCAYLGIIFITKKVFNENTFLPSFIFVLLNAFSFDNLALSDELLGATFLILALSNVFQEIEFRTQRDETTFNLGFFLSLASLFYLPYLIFLFAVLVILFLFARTSLRKVLLLIFGFLLPHLFVLTISYMRGSSAYLWEQYYGNGLSYDKLFYVSPTGLIVLGVIAILYFFVSLVMLNRLARFSKYQSQLLQTNFLWIGFSFIYFLFCPEIRPQTLIVLIPCLTFFFTQFLLLIRRKRFAEMNFWILTTGVITFGYLARYDNLPGVDYDRLTVKEPAAQVRNERLLVLTNEIEYYQQNTPATPFINWKLAEPIFRNPDYFESVARVHDGFKKESPALIIDPQNLMSPFLNRIPALQKIYRREGNTYRKISN